MSSLNRQNVRRVATEKQYLCTPFASFQLILIEYVTDMCPARYFFFICAFSGTRAYEIHNKMN